ncbi:uncharacterized protein F4822DRAFT_216535 [Hypoxylon trugodes]|uniref:uncharacterized protein n=1 Tax=Hypoxylon trugodes TaxID=326681 RepID=UPI0021A22CD6|nr:uncharacterized protein F4822DRAFT_216535 [Hypoxylon trugodes]KAI1389851.1 hypothetical protein F4822DRAFT_216535 [Hypoxylon trugodes]
MSSPSSSRRTSRTYDTGFPDAFADYTTSLRHPEANVSPGACISAEDIDPSKTLQRTRRSFLAKHKHTISHGMIAQDASQHHSNNSALALPTVDSAVDVGDLKPTDSNGSVGRSSKDGTESIEVSSINGDSPSAQNEDDLTDNGRQRINLFRKWRSQKD